MVSHVPSNNRGFMFFNARMKMALGIAHIISITLITFQNVNSTLIYDQHRHVSIIDTYERSRYEFQNKFYAFE